MDEHNFKIKKSEKEALTFRRSIYSIKKIHIVSPGFSSDCLETIEELEIENKKNFLFSGGEKYNYIKCLNDNPQHLKMLGFLILNHIKGWLENKK